MINKIKKAITEEQEVAVSVTCDVCGKVYKTEISGFDDDVFEVQEFTHIRLHGGYGSIFGDGDTVECDLCQNCLKDVLGAHLRITEGY
jgi:hypothetical protein